MVATTSTGIMLRLARVRHQPCHDTRPAEPGLSLAPLSSGEGKAGGLVVEQGLKDGIGEAALEYPKCLASAVPTALAPFDHPFGRRMPTGLGECDAV